mmetsp:Transcript_34032/g.77727  ORF Transcript_34032/g.77727 Transcript_34032/m.77727 type:complete len:231 (+) Transcript_34032:60-752(+)
MVGVAGSHRPTKAADRYDHNRRFLADAVNTLSRLDLSVDDVALNEVPLDVASSSLRKLQDEIKRDHQILGKAAQSQVLRQLDLLELAANSDDDELEDDVADLASMETSSFPEACLGGSAAQKHQYATTRCTVLDLERELTLEKQRLKHYEELCSLFEPLDVTTIPKSYATLHSPMMDEVAETNRLVAELHQLFRHLGPSRKRRGKEPAAVAQPPKASGLVERRVKPRPAP